MFLDVLRRRNPALVRAAVELHRAGEIPANSYVLDLDAIGANTNLFADEAARLGLRPYAMTKQIGRSPAAIAAIAAAGIDAGVAVDMTCARALRRAGMKVGHLGHLVQVPQHEASEAAAIDPENWTVFNLAKATEASDAAAELGRTQTLLARVHAEGDRFYPGHEGGFPAAKIESVAQSLDQLAGARFGGVTTFPAILFDLEAGEPRATPNLATLAHAAEQLRDEGRAGVAVNAPGTTSTRTLKLLADAGATQVEPGHALTGTTPWHALADLPERPAMLYLTEVSHRHGERSYCFGGGLYVDPVFPPYQVRALVGADAEQALSSVLDAFLPDPQAIDYYGQLEGSARVGDSVVFGFRAQAFVTRALVVALRGVSSGAAEVAGITTAAGYSAEGAG